MPNKPFETQEGIKFADGTIQTTAALNGSTGPAGPQGDTGPTGPAGPQGEQGLSIVLKGEVATVGDLPPSGNQLNDGYVVSAEGNLYVWNGSIWFDAGQIVGPQGETGPQGLQGETGPTGPQGEQGLPGSQGIQGDPGAQGDTGPTGPQGLQGDQGIQGEVGPTGPQGEVGPTGPQGDVGDEGVFAQTTAPANTDVLWLDTSVDGIEGIGPTGPAGDTGPTGPQGIQGDQGIQGIQGVQGEVGPTGPQGIQGIQGDAGPQGIQGEVGPTGPQGIQGVQGVQGVQGEVGPTGPQGETGPIGPQGADSTVPGPQGPQGDTGPTGPQGDQGTQGIQGEAGPTGPQGEVGPTGAQGVSIVLKGEVATVGDLPVLGNAVNDAYVVTADGNLWAWNGTSWFDAGQIVGPQGPAGATGDTGPTGPQGIQGEAGPTGSQGPAGLQGDTGPTGPQGIQGDQGIQGIQGEVGPTGPQGLQGDQGLQGIQGIQGEVGPTGPQGLQGDPGPAGADGMQGPPGIDGATGPTGSQGETGPTGPAGTTNYDDLTGRIEYTALGALVEKTVVLGAGTLSYTPTIETGIIAAGNHTGSYAGLTVQNQNAGATSSANIYFSNTGAAETGDFVVMGLNGPNYDFGYDSIDGAKKLLYIANTDGDITLIPNYFGTGNIHLGYGNGGAAISVTHQGGLSLGTTWNNAAQTYVLNPGSAGQVLTSGGNAAAVSWTTPFDGAYSSLTGAPTLATVATSGSYSDLSNKPPMVSPDFVLHVAKNGNDTTGDGSVLNPYLTLGKAIAVAGDAYKIVLHPGAYAEDIEIANKNYLTIVAVDSGGRGSLGSYIVGNVTVSGTSASNSFKCIGITNTLTHSASGSLFLTNVQLGTSGQHGTLNKTGTGYLQANECIFNIVNGANLTSANITGAGSVVFNNVNVTSLTINNASASVTVLDGSVTAAVTLTAGTLNVANSYMYTLGNSGFNAVNATGGTLQIRNSVLVNPNLTPARVNLAVPTVFAYDDIYFDRAGSTLGVNANVTVDFQSVRLSGSITSTGFVGNGSQLTNLNLAFSQLSNVVAVPTTSKGQSGDVAGRMAVDGSYFYYCTGSYDGTADIWKRVAWSGDTW